MDSVETTGQFWSPVDESKVSYGELAWEPGSSARLKVALRVVDEAARPFEIDEVGTLSILSTDSPADLVADNVPRVLLGNTAAFGPVSCIDAYLQHLPTNLFDFDTPPLQQVWDPYVLVLGAHFAAGQQTELDAIRVVLDGPGWWSHLADGSSATDDAGEVVCSREKDGPTWLEFRPSSPLALRGADRAIRSLVTLGQLALDTELTTARLQILESGHTEWLEVKTSSIDPSKASRPNPHNRLLPPQSLTLERLARWLDIEQTMDGLAAAVANPVEKSAIQVQALVAGSLIEGIHKRIVDDSNCHYAVRARDLCSIAQRIEGTVIDPVSDWVTLIKRARNDLAHHNTGVPFEEQVYNWIIANSSITWVLRLCLLSHAGFEDEELRAALAQHRPYEFYRENQKMHVKERDELTLP